MKIIFVLQILAAVAITFVTIFMIAYVSFIASIASMGIPPKPPRYDRSKPTELFLILERTEEGKPEGYFREEFYVVANAPRSEKEILEIVEEYNRRTITAEALQTTSYWREFYWETEELARDFEEKSRVASRRGLVERSPVEWIRSHRDYELIYTHYGRTMGGRSTTLSYRFPTGPRNKKDIPDIYDYFADYDSAEPINEIQNPRAGFPVIRLAISGGTVIAAVAIVLIRRRRKR